MNPLESGFVRASFDTSGGGAPDLDRLLETE